MKTRFILLVAMIGVLGLFAYGQTTDSKVSSSTGSVSGHVQQPDGIPITDGIITFTTDGKTVQFTFKTDSNGDYSGSGIAPGTYIVNLRRTDTPQDKVVDTQTDVKIAIGKSLKLDFDMSRPDYIKKLSPEDQKRITEIVAKNKTAIAENALIKNLNGDLASARASTKAKDYAAAETLMLRDTGLLNGSSIRPDQAALLWIELGSAQNGLKKYDEAVDSLQKALNLNASSSKPNPEASAVANNTLGEALVKAGKYDEAKAAYDAASKANPPLAGIYYLNEAISFFQLRGAQPDAQAEAADKAIAADPTKALAYYLKASALVSKASFDDKTSKIVLPPGCADAYQKYIELDPTGQFVNDAKGVLEQAGQTVKSTYKSGRK